ncbi:paraquat-inducible protein A [Vibrio hepatarius]|uniref:paraquat-inducible protein A n=1 Tax=Vibrio hepatarius TaxID=171383 RepID=UPI001C0A4CCD|nr:paraquat-inducible protein A [Vibrio hepatarius]MBU2898862.1 paraquat-inducible protein A [Vibrio hepatarius]
MISPCTEPKNVTQAMPHTRLCHGCDLPISSILLEKGKSAYCPRCGIHLYRGGSPSLSGNLAIAIACLLLYVPSHFFAFISIRLFGVMIPATLPSGILTLYDEGFVFLSLLILFCSSIAPFLLCFSVVAAHLALQFNNIRILKYALYTIKHLKVWVMIDVFLVSIAISCFKLQDYSDIHMGIGLYGFVLLQLMTVLLVTRVSVHGYWEKFRTELSYHFNKKELHCLHCHLSQPTNNLCVRCKQPISRRKSRSIQKTWAYIVAATIVIFPANLVPISILITNGRRIEDTIFSGVVSLLKSDMWGIALIIFIASIIVPVAKILGLSYLLLSIKFKRRMFRRQRMTIYFIIKWIGRWSMMDLFVICIMMTVIDRGQILDFTPGFGAVAFGLVVLLTMFAAESIDPRLIWDDHSVEYKTEQREDTLNG